MIDLHAHGTCSFKDGIGTMTQIADRLLELNREVMVLTDHDNIYSAPLMQVWAEPKGLKCIYGCEIRTVKDIDAMRENKQRKKNHLTLLAKTTEGYGNICKLVTFANMEGHYYFPTIDFDVLDVYKKDIIVLSGCPTSYLYELILGKDLSGAVEFCKNMKTMLDGNFYIEVMPHDLDMVHEAAPVLRAIAKKLDIPMVLTNDSHFLTADQARIWKLMRAIRLATTVDQIDDSLQTCYYMTDDEAWEHANNVLGSYFTKPELLSMFNVQETIASDCNARVEKVGSVDSGSENPHEELVRMTYQGLTDKGLDKPEYRERLERELDLVGRKGFSDYFLVVADLIKWCKSHDILVGPSRGCFLPGNRVYGSYGERRNRSFIPIEKLRIGDKVLTAEGNYKDILKKFEYDINEECVEIVLEDNESCKERPALGINKVITCTVDHEISTPNGMVKAGELVAEMELMAPLSSGWAQLRMKCVDCGVEKLVFLKKLLGYNSYSEDGTYRCHQCANMELSRRPEQHANLVKAAHRSKDPEVKARISESVSLAMKNGVAARISESMKTKWKDPEYIENWKNGMRGSFQKGEYHSKKMDKLIPYDSSWELEAMRIFDHADDVKSYERFDGWIDCFYGDKWHRYNPDFDLEFVDGQTYILEIKPDWLLQLAEGKAKVEAGVKYAEDNGYTGYNVWGDETFINDLKHYNVKVKSVRKFRHTGKVYDIEVEDDHTYNVEGIGVHNSAGGFLTSYCMDIIDLDPLPFDLVMERFLSEDRVDPPDIDLDFQASLRDTVIKHLQEKYGENNVAHITTFQHYKGKNTLIDVGKAYGIPMYEVDKVKNVLLERGKADARASATIEDTFLEFSQAAEVADKYPGIMDAKYLEGQIRHAGVNAAGILVTRKPMDGSCSFREKDSKWVASVDLYGAELIDTLKLDILGIKELDILKQLCESTDTDDREVFHFGLDDRKVLDIFEGNTLGIFQFGATGTASLIKQLIPINTFDDIVLANALCLRWDTEIKIIEQNNDGSVRKYNKRIKDIEVGENVVSISPNGRGYVNEVSHVIHKGTMPVYRVMTKSGRYIDATLDHGVYTPHGWKKVKELSVGSEVTLCTCTGNFGNHPDAWNKGLTKETSPEVEKYASQIRGKPKSEKQRGNQSFSMKLWCKNHPDECVDKAKMLAEANAIWWNNLQGKEREVFINNLQRRGTKAALEKWHNCTDEERAAWTKGLSLSRGFGNNGTASDGHYVASNGELELDNWLYKNEIEHIPHPKIPGYWKFADQLVDDWYIEYDGMFRHTDNEWGGKLSIYEELGFNYVIVRSPNEFEEKLGFLKKVGVG